MNIRKSTCGYSFAKISLFLIGVSILFGCESQNTKYKLNPYDYFPGAVVEFIYAVDNGNTVEAKKLINNGVDVNFEGKDGATPLLWILSQSQKPTSIQELIKLGANPNRISKNGYSPVYFSAEMDVPKTTELLEILLKNGGNPNISNPIKKTPVVINALHSHNNRNVMLLMDYGADINAVDDNGESLLVNAAILNQHDLMKNLMQRGVTITDKDKDFLIWHFKNLHIANEYQNEADAVKYLLMKRGINFE